MTVRTIGTATGVGITALLVVGAIVTTIAAMVVEFSVFVGLPAGVLAGALVLVWSHSVLTGRPSALTERGLSAVAAFGYVVLLLLSLQYAVPGVRPVLTAPAVLGIGLLAAAGLFVYLGRSTKKRSPMDG